MPVFDLRQQCHRFEQMRHAVFNVFSVFNGNFTCRDIQNMFTECCMDGVFQLNRQRKPLKCRPQFICSRVDMQANPYVLHSNFEELDLAYRWLLDSGASKSIVSRRYLDRYEIVRSRTRETPLVFQTISNGRWQPDSHKFRGSFEGRSQFAGSRNWPTHTQDCPGSCICLERGT